MMDIMYSSTRNAGEKVLASKAVLQGLADDGGLYVPDRLPRLDIGFKDMVSMDYRQIAYEVMKLFLTDYTKDELMHCINSAYDSKFDTEEIAPLTYADGTYYLELFHGATIAFKDMALAILPYLMTTAAKKNQLKEEIVILTATSGDTGKAAMAGFADVEGTRIVVFYPKNGVSAVQEKQMVTQKGKNVKVIGIRGNFDDAQTGVKKMFSDQELKRELKEHGFVFSSANSINIGRLVPQIVYYVYAYVNLLKNGKIQEGDEINVVVPTGNFGNILAAYYAKNLGLPIHKLICASNENKVLYDFFQSGVYDRNREFVLTSSPSMDILISSNLERLIYMISDCDPEKNRELMSKLTENGVYEITSGMKEKLDDFYGGYTSEKMTAEKIRNLYEKTGYVIDTHTAVASAVYDAYKADVKDERISIIASTASPYKFARSVMTSIDPSYKEMDDFALIDELCKISKVEVPKAVDDIRQAPVLHDTVCEKDEMQTMVRGFLGI